MIYYLGKLFLGQLDSEYSAIYMVSSMMWYGPRMLSSMWSSLKEAATMLTADYEVIKVRMRDVAGAQTEFTFHVCICFEPSSFTCAFSILNTPPSSWPPTHTHLISTSRNAVINSRPGWISASLGKCWLDRIFAMSVMALIITTSGTTAGPRTLSLSVEICQAAVGSQRGQSASGVGRGMASWSSTSSTSFRRIGSSRTIRTGRKTGSGP